METTAIRSLSERVAAFPQWHYEIDLGGVTTPIFRRNHVNRHAQRARYFFDPLVALCGGSLRGRRVLDLGCNAGFWSLKALDAGADFVLGVDGRQMHIDQANLVMGAKGIDSSRFHFEPANVFEWDPNERFDVVLCLGLLYHVARPVELLERCSRLNTDLLVLDTTLSYLPGSALQVRREPTSEPRASIEYELVLYPTHDAVIDLCACVGYRRTVALRPHFSSWEGCQDFRLGARRAFIASKNTALTGLDEDHRRLRRDAALRAAEALARRIHLGSRARVKRRVG